MRAFLPILTLIPLILAGCNNGCPEVEKLDTKVEDPGLVQMLFSVRCEGEPLVGLQADDVSLTEAGSEVSPSEAGWVVQDVVAALDSYTLLLVDVSDSIISEGTLEVTREVAADFGSSLIGLGHKVSVAVFDGDPNIRTIIDFTEDETALVDAIDSIDQDDQLDGSTNLNGAIVEALEQLDGKVVPDVEAELMSVANLVVFTDGVDRAGRVTHSKATSTINGSDHEVYVVGLVGEEDVEELQELARDGFFRADDAAALTEAFADLESKLVAEVSKYYRLSYCSPLRNPRTTLKVTVHHGDKSSSVSFSYPTKDFGPGCTLPGRGR